MNKCFVTKLPSSVDNDNLPVLGQLRINWSKQSDLTDNEQRVILLATNDSITVKVSGAHLTDSTLASNLGNTKTITAADGEVLLYVSNDADAVLTIDNKYSLTDLNFSYRNNRYIHSAYFDIEDIKYCTNLTELNLSNTQVSGDISAVSNLVNLTAVFLQNTEVSGNINALSNLTNITILGVANTKVSGDISALNKLTKLNKLSIGGTSIIGDMSKIPAQLSYISMINTKFNTNFTWTANGRQNATLIAMVGHIPFDTASMDNMFIDQATCTLKADESSSWTKLIEVQGTRTSASDAAVATLQSMGITITGVTKQA